MNEPEKPAVIAIGTFIANDEIGGVLNDIRLYGSGFQEQLIFQREIVFGEALSELAENVFLMKPRKRGELGVYILIEVRSLSKSLRGDGLLVDIKCCADGPLRIGHLLLNESGCHIKMSQWERLQLQCVTGFWNGISERLGFGINKKDACIGYGLQLGVLNQRITINQKSGRVKLNGVATLGDDAFDIDSVGLLGVFEGDDFIFMGFLFG